MGGGFKGGRSEGEGIGDRGVGGLLREKLEREEAVSKNEGSLAVIQTD